jgi:hypothetical protein
MDERTHLWQVGCSVRWAGDLWQSNLRTAAVPPSRRGSSAVVGRARLDVVVGLSGGGHACVRSATCTDRPPACLRGIAPAYRSRLAVSALSRCAAFDPADILSVDLLRRARAMDPVALSCQNLRPLIAEPMVSDDLQSALGEQVVQGLPLQVILMSLRFSTMAREAMHMHPIRAVAGVPLSLRRAVNRPDGDQHLHFLRRALRLLSLRTDLVRAIDGVLDGLRSASYRAPPPCMRRVQFLAADREAQAASCCLGLRVLRAPEQATALHGYFLAVVLVLFQFLISVRHRGFDRWVFHDSIIPDLTRRKPYPVQMSLSSSS